MKNKLLLVFILVISFIMITSVGASENIDEISVVLDGNQLLFDVQPITINDRTMVPLRAIFEALGATVTWDDTTQTANGVKGDTIVSIKVGEKALYKNGVKFELDVPAQLVDMRTLVPIRAISEAFECQIGWDDDRKIVSIINDTTKFTMLYAPNNRSCAFKITEVNTYLQNGWYRDIELKDNMPYYTNEEIYQQFVDFVKTKGSYNEGKYGVQANIPYHSSQSGDSYGTITLLYNPIENTLEVQVIEMYKSNSNNATTMMFLSIFIPQINDAYKWQFQYMIDYPSYSRYDDYFMASEGTLKTNVDSYLNNDAINMSNVIYGYEITSGSSETHVGTLMLWISVYGNNMFSLNDSTLNFGHLGID